MRLNNDNDRETTVNSLSPSAPDSLDTAANWAVRLDDAHPLSPGEQQQLQNWLDADPQHPHLLRQARHTWSQLASPATHSQPVATAALNITATQASPASHRQRRSWPRPLATAAVVLLAVFGVLQGWQSGIHLRADYIAATGQVLRVELPDGSHALLDSGSAIRLDYGERRHVLLLRGQALFDVAPVTDRDNNPFVVSSQGVETRALGTRFVVSQHEQGWVGVEQHAVRLSSGSHSLILNEGQAARIRPDGSLQSIDLNLSHHTSWQRGLLIFDRAPLAQVVSELNRYHSGHILIRPGTLTRLEVSGVFRLDSLDTALDALQTEFGIQRNSLAGVTLLY